MQIPVILSCIRYHVDIRLRIPYYMLRTPQCKSEACTPKSGRNLSHGSWLWFPPPSLIAFSFFSSICPSISVPHDMHVKHTRTLSSSSSPRHLIVVIQFSLSCLFLSCFIPVAHLSLHPITHMEYEGTRTPRTHVCTNECRPTHIERPAMHAVVDLAGSCGMNE